MDSDQESPDEHRNIDSKSECNSVGDFDDGPDVVEPALPDTLPLDATLPHSRPENSSNEGHPAKAPTPAVKPFAPTAEKIQPEEIGPYRLLEKVGEGGFGIVWRARQSVPVKRDVALKILKAGMDSAEVLLRFEAERQALALMDHPGIAKVIDAGQSEAGHPYFVMELVKGSPINEFCDVHQLDVRARLVLFAEVCDAVHHAHQRAILHRDLKPSNVLVGKDREGDTRIKVIDFGIAKALGSTLTADTLVTVAGQFLGTPAYMSPEQAGMNPNDVDVRSDVFSLGVMLFELLTGSTPILRESFQAGNLETVLRKIREEDPPHPSARISTPSVNAEEEVTFTEQRSTSSTARLAKILKGEIDWIILKALDKERDRRYDNAAAFAEDIRNFLNDRPVNASPPSKAYRMRKFVRRHRVPVAAAAMVLAALVTTTVVTIVQARRAERQRLVAEETRMQAEGLVDYLVNDFSDELSRVGRLDIMEGMAGKVSDYFEGLPSDLGTYSSNKTRASVLKKLADVDLSLQDYKSAEARYKEAREVFLLLASQDKDESEQIKRLSKAADCTHNIGIALRDDGRIDEGQEFLLSSLAERETILEREPEREYRLHSLESIAKVHQILSSIHWRNRDLKTSESELQKSAEAYWHFWKESSRTAESLQGLANMMIVANANKWPLEQIWLREDSDLHPPPPVEAFRSAIDEAGDDPDKIYLAASSLARLRKHSEVIPVLKALAEREPSNIPWVTQYTGSLTSLAVDHYEKGRTPESFEMLSIAHEALAPLIAAHGDNSRVTGQMANILVHRGWVYWRMGEYDKGRTDYRESIRLFEQLSKALGTRFNAREVLALARLRLGEATTDPAEKLELAKAAIAEYEAMESHTFKGPQYAYASAARSCISLTRIDEAKSFSLRGRQWVSEAAPPVDDSGKPAGELLEFLGMFDAIDAEIAEIEGDRVAASTTFRRSASNQIKRLESTGVRTKYQVIGATAGAAKKALLYTDEKWPELAEWASTEILPPLKQALKSPNESEPSLYDARKSIAGLLLHLGEKGFESGHPEASEWYEALIQWNRDWLRKVAAKDPQQAEKIRTRIFEDYLAYYASAKSAADLERSADILREAAALADPWAEAFPGEYVTTRKLAGIYRLLGNLNPSNKDDMFERSITLMQSWIDRFGKDQADKATTLRREILIDFADWEIRLFEADQRTQSLEILDRAIALGRQWIDAGLPISADPVKLQHAALLRRQGDRLRAAERYVEACSPVREAITHFSDLLSRCKSAAEIQSRTKSLAEANKALAMNLASAGDRDGAFVAIDEAIRIFETIDELPSTSGFGEALRRKAGYLLSEGKLETAKENFLRALEQLEIALTSNPERTHTWNVAAESAFELAKLAESDQDLEAGITWWREALRYRIKAAELEPENKKAKVHIGAIKSIIGSQLANNDPSSAEAKRFRSEAWEILREIDLKELGIPSDTRQHKHTLEQEFEPKKPSGPEND